MSDKPKCSDCEWCLKGIWYGCARQGNKPVNPDMIDVDCPLEREP